MIILPLIKHAHDTLKAFNNFKNMQQKCTKYVSLYIKVYIFWKFIQYTIHWDKTQMLQKFLSGK